MIALLLERMYSANVKIACQFSASFMNEKAAKKSLDNVSSRSTADRLRQMR